MFINHLKALSIAKNMFLHFLRTTVLSISSKCSFLLLFKLLAWFWLPCLLNYSGFWVICCACCCCPFACTYIFISCIWKKRLIVRTSNILVSHRIMIRPSKWREFVLILRTMIAKVWDQGSTLTWECNSFGCHRVTEKLPKGQGWLSHGLWVSFLPLSCWCKTGYPVKLEFQMNSELF